MRFTIPLVAFFSASVSANDSYLLLFQDGTCSGGMTVFAMHKNSCWNSDVVGTGSIHSYSADATVRGWSGTDCTGDVVFTMTSDQASATCLPLTGKAVVSWSQ